MSLTWVGVGYRTRTDLEERANWAQHLEQGRVADRIMLEGA